VQITLSEPSRSAANIGTRLTETARVMPEAPAVVMPAGRTSDGRYRYRQMTFGELDRASDRVACGLRRWGVPPGTRLVLMVRPGIDFILATFALFKAGAVVVLIDPGMGPRHVFRCLTEVVPAGFVGLPQVQALRILLRRRFPLARWNVTVGRRWCWGGPTLNALRQAEVDRSLLHAGRSTDPAAIIFTTGSTGPPKGVLYEHGNFAHQVQQIRDRYGIQPGEVDLPGFPLFGLFNAAMGVTTVIPDMDSTRPAEVVPARIVQAVRDWRVTQAFGSPAMWNVVGRYCERQGVVLTTLRRVLSAGAPVPPHVLERMQRAIAPDGEVHTPYGATEALPVASISAREVRAETASRSAEGAGTCVGTRFDGIEWRVIRIHDGPLADIGLTEQLPRGAMGELIVRGRVVTRQYVTRVEANAWAKIADGDGFWHRMGDVGYLDEQDRFWFCGRLAHRVLTPDGPMFTIPCEAIFNRHPRIYRCALVGVGPRGGQVPVIVAEPWPDQAPRREAERARLCDELYQLAQAHTRTRAIQRGQILLHPSLPVDVRHNSKIVREQVAVWAERRLRSALGFEPPAPQALPAGDGRRGSAR